jgi:hypothetical protein
MDNMFVTCEEGRVNAYPVPQILCGIVAGHSQCNSACTTPISASTVNVTSLVPTTPGNSGQPTSSNRVPIGARTIKGVPTRQERHRFVTDCAFGYIDMLPCTYIGGSEERCFEASRPLYAKTTSATHLLQGVLYACGTCCIREHIERCCGFMSGALFVFWRISYVLWRLVFHIPQSADIP